MAKGFQRLETDVVVAGSGPGGGTVARELALKGKKVILVERGDWLKGRRGTLMATAKAFEQKGRMKTLEGDSLSAGIGVGGSSLIYCGTAYEPDYKQWKKYGIDLTEATQEAMKECKVQAMPDSFVGPGVKRFWEAAREQGYPCEKLSKFIDFEKCKIGCNKCSMTCPTGAKWTSESYVKEAMSHGATGITNATAKEVMVENGVATGMKVTGKKGEQYEIYAKVVICAAGGANTARILKRSGIYEAGNSFLADPAAITWGYFKEGPHSQKVDFSMSVGWHDDDHHVMFCNISMPRTMMLGMALIGPSKLREIRDLFRYGRGIAVMEKITDEDVGYVSIEEGKISKILTMKDKIALNYGRTIGEKLLLKAGCDPQSIKHMPAQLAHPGSTVKVGTLLDSNLETTSIKNLYCCDASAVPEGLGIPPTLTIIALGKYLGSYLNTKL